MKKEKLAHHLNCIKMCESDRAIERRIETIFAEGVNVGWDESNQCPECHRFYPDCQPTCDFCGNEKGEKDDS